VPAPDADAPTRYRRLHQALRTGRIVACHDVSEGGLAVAAAEMAIAGDLGAVIDLSPVDLDDTSTLFAESTGRLLCEVAQADVGWLAAQLDEPVTVVGQVTEARAFTIADSSGVRHTVALDQLVSAFTGGTR
jgi:phosphoribosylformylglycinamidine synthase